ncbi:phage holin family protein [Aeromicrobium sp. IC_218]|uniref:phage holin family protein n=1 Tax=Aeromicrobium sp. IC_218 TaxID=2545468 RepID=UPI00103F6FA1|nr:phage holin family protein [Aeromicrobium sp. IC_218]TCJ00547.1 phage holin family protein [Aeromicrobium sp. IC_218]
MTGAPQDRSTGELLSALSEQVSTLVRDEMRLARAEMSEAGKRYGIGAGMFGGAGLVALYGLGVLIAAAVLGLAAAVDAWLAALIVAVVLFVVAGVLALVGKKNVDKAPSFPGNRVESVKADVEAAKERHV